VVAESRLVSLLLFSDSGVAVLLLLLVVVVVVVPVVRPTPPQLLLLSVAEVDAVVPITMILCSRLFTNTCFGGVVLALVDVFKVVGWLLASSCSSKGTIGAGLVRQRGSWHYLSRSTMSLPPQSESHESHESPASRMACGGLVVAVMVFPSFVVSPVPVHPNQDQTIRRKDDEVRLVMPSIYPTFLATSSTRREYRNRQVSENVRFHSLHRQG
jgi:hypothetical protein